MAVRVYLAYSAEPLNNSLREKLWEQIAAEPIATAAKPTKGRVPAVRRWAFGGIAAAVGIGGIAFFALPGTPGQPTVAFAQVEAAMAQVRTAAWTETITFTVDRTPPQTYTKQYEWWASLQPGRIAQRWIGGTERNERPWRFVSDGTTTLGYAESRWGNGRETARYFRSEVQPEALEINGSTPQERIRGLLLFPMEAEQQKASESQNESAYARFTRQRSAWRSRREKLAGQTALRFDSHLTTIIVPKTEDTTETRHEADWSIWVDPKTYRILRREIVHLSSPSKSSLRTWRSVSENFRYNETPPATAFTIPPPPVGKPYQFSDGLKKTTDREASPTDTARVREMVVKAVSAWNRRDTPVFAALWDFSFVEKQRQALLGEQPDPNRTREQERHWLSRLQQGVPYRKWQIEDIGTVFGMSHFLVRQSSREPFPPTDTRHTTYTVFVNGMAVLKAGEKPVPCSTVFMLHRTGDDFRIAHMNMYPRRVPTPGWAKKQETAKPSGMGKRPAGRP
jgi:outer membrane lipoprotein-sorting protein